jgi:hypothetical protein
VIPPKITQYFNLKNSRSLLTLLNHNYMPTSPPKKIDILILLFH